MNIRIILYTLFLVPYSVSFSQKEVKMGDTLIVFNKNNTLKSKNFFCDSLKEYKLEMLYSPKGRLQSELFSKADGEKLSAKKWYYNPDRTYGYQLTEYKKPQADVIYTEEYYPDGTLKMTSPMAANAKYGNSITYHRNKKIETDYNYIKGVKSGIQKRYYDNGQLQMIAKYVNGKIDSVETYYYPNGQLWTEIINQFGKTIEVKSNFKPDGTPLDKGNLYMGTGYRNVYNEYGDWIYMEKYKKGKFKKVIRRRYY